MKISHKSHLSAGSLLCAGTGVVSGILLLVMPPLHALVIVAGIFVLALIAIMPEIGILIMVVLLSSIVFEKSLPLIPIGVGSFHVSDVILLFMLGTLVFKVFTIGHTYIRAALDLPLLLFLVTVLISAFISVTYYGTDFNLVLRLLRVLTYYLIVILITNLIRDERQIRFLIIGLFVIAAVVAATMLIQTMIGESVQLMPGRIETAGTFGQEYEALRILPPGQTLIFISLITSICVIAFRQQSSLFVFGYFYLVILLGIGVVLTYNRNYWVALLLAVSLLLLMIRTKNKNKLLALLMVVTISAGSLFALFDGSGGKVDKTFDAVSSRFSSLVTGKKLIQSSSLEDRYLENRYAIKQIERHLILGIGLGNDYRPEVPGIRQNLTYYVHNAYLWILIDTGLPGFLFFFWFYIQFLIRAVKNWKRIQDNFLKSAVLGFMISGIVILPMALVTPIFLQWYSIVVIAIMIGLTESIIRNSEMNIENVEVIK